MQIFKNMKTTDICSIVILLLLIIKITLSSSFSITNGPQDTTVCMNAMAECNCGFTGTDPSFAVPNWRIVFRSDNGSFISNDTINGFDILNRLINGLQWIPDLTSGDNNAPNSKLLIGPVNMTHNQSSYQCTFAIVSGSAVSSVGTITVVGPPSVIINVNEICTSSITILFSTHSHPACGAATYNVTISGDVIYQDMGHMHDGSSNYTIDELQSNTLYNITVTSTYNSGSRIVYRSVRTSLPNPPNPIDITSIIIDKPSCCSDHVRVTWKPPEIDNCSMLAVKHYDVRISNKDQIISQKLYNTTNFLFDHSDYHLNFTLNINIAVIDIKGQRSNSTVITKTIGIQTKISINESNETVGEHSTNERHCEIFIGLSVVFIVISVITTTISVILSWKLCSQKRNNESDVVMIPPAQLQRQLNVDNIQMQSSPAYVSIDNKSPRLYQNIARE